MSDFKWLESELARQLGPVAAPEEIWRRIQTGRAAPRRHRSLVWWPVAAATLLLASAGLLWELNKARGAPTLDPLVRDLAQIDTGALGLVSDDPVAIRNWVKVNGNIDIELPAGRSGGTRIVGARVVGKGGATIAEIVFQTEGHGPSTLMVSRSHGNGARRHGFSRAASGTRQFLSWEMGGQLYTVAWAGRGGPEEACGLCHADGVRKL